MATVTGAHLFLVFLKAFHSVSDYASQSIRGSRLGDSDFRVLEALLHKGPMPVNTIGPKVFLTPGSISVAVDRLLAKGLVTREDSKDDRRVRLVRLTPDGRKLIQRVFTVHAKELEELATVLTDSERAQLVHALKKLGKHAAARLRA